MKYILVNLMKKITGYKGLKQEPVLTLKQVQGFQEGITYKVMEL